MNFSEGFAVLMAVYLRDDPELFECAVHSVFANTLQPDQFILVCDGRLSQELEQKVVFLQSRYANRIQLLRLQKNLGLANALNAGLAAIHTEYTIRADADDFNRTDRFKMLVSKLNEGFDLVGSAIREVDKDGIEVAFRSCPLQEKEIRKFVRKRNPLNHMTVGFRTKAVIEAGGYPSIYLKEDYALWATLLAKDCKVCNLADVLVDATAGTEMFQRRGGLRYALAEVDLQRHLVKCGLKSPFWGLIDGFMRSIVFLAPNAVREFIYLKFLRAQKGKE